MYPLLQNIRQRKRAGMTETSCVSWDERKGKAKPQIKALCQATARSQEIAHLLVSKAIKNPSGSGADMKSFSFQGN
eukprot:scaffold80656_cov22-Tisochrysis_lutea.AAC.2